MNRVPGFVLSATLAAAAGCGSSNRDASQNGATPDDGGGAPDGGASASKGGNDGGALDAGASASKGGNGGSAGSPDGGDAMAMGGGASGSPGCESFQCWNGRTGFSSGCPGPYTECDPALNDGVECVQSGPCPSDVPNIVACEDAGTGGDPLNCGACGHACAPVTLLAPGDLTRGSLASDGANLYVTGGIYDWVKKIPSGGGSPETLWNGSPNAAAQSLALGATHVYWSTLDLGTAHYSVSRLPTAGGAPETIVADAPVVDRLAVNSTHLFWSGFSSSKGAVMKTPLAGGASTDLVSGVVVMDIVVDESRVYFSTVDKADTKKGAVQSVPVGGGTPTTLASGEVPSSGTLAVDGTHVYWAVFVDGAHDLILKVPIGGGTVTTLATDLHWPAALAVNAAGVFVVTSGSPTAPQGVSGAVLRIPLAGGTPTVLANRFGSPVSIAVDGTSVFWEADFFQAKISRIALDPCQSGVCAP